SHRRQLLHFTRNRLSPSTIRAYLRLGALGRCNLLSWKTFWQPFTSRKRKQSEDVEE
ncbi:hypothetical protein SCLCIDRAFT_115483, partial [Scleroderma citrinum Foug A]